MIIDSVLSLKTNPGLLDVLKKSLRTKLSPNDLLEQRVSFVFGSMKSQNGVTKDRVRQMILEQVGDTAQAGK